MNGMISNLRMIYLAIFTFHTGMFSEKRYTNNYRDLGQGSIREPWPTKLRYEILALIGHIDGVTLHRLITEECIPEHPLRASCTVLQ
jgi:hypothetical protein